VAQPAATSLGVLPTGPTQATGNLNGGEVLWYTFTVPAITGQVYLDIDTEGSSLSPGNDTELGLYDSAGVLIATDDDDGNALMSQLTFGSNIGRPAVGIGLVYDGRDGTLAAGTYYLSVSAFNSTFATAGWGVTSTSANSGGYVVNLTLGTVTAGACCLSSGLCLFTTPEDCTSQGGVYRGDNTACATANCPAPAGTFVELGDAGQLPGTAAVARGEGSLYTILGQLGSSDADMFRIRICDPANFSATTVGGTAFDTQLFLFNSDGTGVVFNDDSQTVLQSTLTNTFVSSLPAGDFYLAVSRYDYDPTGANGSLWLDTPFTAERSPDGPGAADPVAAWEGTTVLAGAYTVALTGTCFAEAAGAGCYANCDSSTSVPFLNINDFICFQSKFAAGDSYANCDASTSAPVLNINDFICFQSKFAAGCSAP
jgi:hypothetical protein